jgi:hypothetical protein
MGSVDLAQKNEVKYLGMHLDRRLTWIKREPMRCVYNHILPRFDLIVLMEWPAVFILAYAAASAFVVCCVSVHINGD